MNNIEAWIALDLIAHIGPKSVRKLINIYKSPEKILDTPVARIKELGLLNTTQLNSLSKGPDMVRVSDTIKSLKQNQAHALAISDTRYPAILKEIDDPPSVLYIKGSLDDLQPAVSIVGTRSPSHYGREIGYKMAADLSMRGVNIVSGMARGIDRHAHIGALEGLSKTVAVLGSGIDVIYPPEHADLAENIASKGAVITEFAPGTKPDPTHFPRRNRIISGLSTGVIVIEASIKSGAMITARLAGEHGRLIMAVPGMTTNARSQGPHHLIRQGAVLVRNADDVMMEIAPQVIGILKENNTTKTAENNKDDLINHISGEALSIEEIACILDTDIAEATRRVSMLELKGEIVRVEGSRFTSRRCNV